MGGCNEIWDEEDKPMSSQAGDGPVTYEHGEDGSTVPSTLPFSICDKCDGYELIKELSAIIKEMDDIGKSSAMRSALFDKWGLTI